MQEQFTRLRNGYAGLPRRAQIAIVAVAVVTVFIMLMVIRSASSTSWVVVPTDPLRGDQAAKAQQALTDAKIKNRLGANATTIEVTQAEVANATAALAAAHVSGVGTHTTCQEDSNSSSSFVAAGSEQTKNRHISCLQNEMANVVESFPGVASAQVNLKMPDAKLFTTEQKPAGASVNVTMDGSSRLDRDQVKAIQEYISNAVVDIKATDVTVIDSEGVLSGSASESGKASVSESTLKLNIERMQNGRIESDLTKKFSEIAGAGKVNVISNVELDMDKVRSEVKDYGGADNQQGPKGAETGGVEIVNGDVSAANGGPAGTASNVGQDAVNTATTGTSTTGASTTTGGTTTNASNNSIVAASGSASGTKNYWKDDKKITYNNDEVAQAIEQAPGAVKRNRLAITVDQSVPLDTQQAIKAAAQAYLGGNPADSFAFSAAKFDFNSGSKAVAAGRVAAIKTYAKWLVAGFGLLGMAFLLRRQLNQRTEELLYPIDEPFLLEQGGFEPIPLAELEAAVAAATSLDNQKRLELQRKVEQIAEEKPQDVANQLRGWLHDDADAAGYDYSAPSRR